jgi:hypothetical protein
LSSQQSEKERRKREIVDLIAVKEKKELLKLMQSVFVAGELEIGKLGLL